MALNQNAWYGSAMLSAIHTAVGWTFGNVFIVVNSSDTADTNYQHLQELFIPDNDGRVRFYSSLESAYAATQTNNNDVIILDWHSTHALADMLSISKSRVHFIWLDYLLGNRRKYGQSSKVSMLTGTSTANIFNVKNTWVRNSFKGIKFMNDTADTSIVSTFWEWWEYTYFENCEFYNSQILNSDTVSEMVLNGDSTQFKNCTFGSLADSVVWDKVRPAILLTAGTVGAWLVCRDVTFDWCNFWKNAGWTTTAMIKGWATDVERVMIFNDCGFVANVLGAQPAVAIDVATLTRWQILLTGNTYSAECTKLATATGVFSSLPARVATATIWIQAT